MTDSQDRQLSDILDRASAIEMEATENAISDVRRHCKPQQLPRADGTYEFVDCEGCGLEIGEGRLKVAIRNLYCIHCAERMERRR
jgi:RNA polymerase-binding transcription factor DksA